MRSNKIQSFFTRRKNWSVPYALFLAFFVLLPLVLIVYYAFTTPEGQFTFGHFRKFWLQAEALNTFIYSVGIAIITTLLCLLLGYPAAYILSRINSKRSRVLVMLFILPMWINFLIRTLATVARFDFFGLPLGEGALLFGMVYNFLPFMIISIYTVLAKLDKALIHASHDLGANPLQTFLRVVLPLSLPGVISGITLVFLPAVSTFVIPKFLGGGQYMLIGNLIENQFITVGEWNFGSAISLIMAIIIMGSMILTRKIDRDASDTASVEGGKLW